MNRGRYSLVSLHDLETAFGKIHYLFMGLKQHASHEFIILMFNCLHEDLIKGVTPVYLMDDVINSKPSSLHSLFQVERQHRINYDTCQ